MSNNKARNRIDQRKRRHRRRRRAEIQLKLMLIVLVLIGIIAAVVFGLKSCGNDVGDIELKANRSAIYIKDSGKVVYGMAEDFKGEQFDEEALEKEIDAEVEAFNNSNGSEDNAMKLKDFEMEETVAKVVFQFETENDFISYMNLYNRENDFVKQEEDAPKVYDFYLNSVSEYDGDGEMVVVSPKSGEKVSLRGTKGTLLIVSGGYDIQIDGDVSYMSDNCKLEDGIVKTSDEGRSFIIFE